MATLETVGKVPALVRGTARKQVIVVIDTFVDHLSVRHCSKYNDQFTYSSPHGSTRRSGLRIPMVLMRELRLRENQAHDEVASKYRIYSI